MLAYPKKDAGSTCARVKSGQSSPNKRNDMSNGHFIAMIRSEMKSLGISKARLVRHCRTLGITAARVEQALKGDPGWRGKWNECSLRDWLEAVRGAWLA